jgi:hypothetical protein
MFPMKYDCQNKRIFEIDNEQIIDMNISIWNPPYKYSYTIFNRC